MSHDVHLSVVFACDENDGVAEIAKRHLDTVGENREARWFLDALSKRSGKNPGPKGGLSLWGVVGNPTGPCGCSRPMRSSPAEGSAVRAGKGCSGPIPQ